MERKRARFKDSDIESYNKEKTSVCLIDDGEVYNTNSETQTDEKTYLLQSCLFDPSSMVDSSSSYSGESSSSNEWVNCDDDLDESDEEKSEASTVIENRKSTPAKKNTSCDDILEKGKTKESKCSKNESENINQTNKPSLPIGDNNHGVNYPNMNKLQVYRNGIEPYLDEKLMSGHPQAVLSSISKLYIGGYSELSSIRGYVSESEASSYGEDGNKRAIKSILKRHGSNQTGDNPKKKVRFDLNLRTSNDLSPGLDPFPTSNGVKAGVEILDKKVKSDDNSKEPNSQNKWSSDDYEGLIVEKNLQYNEHCSSDNVHYKCSSKTSREKVVEENLTIYNGQCTRENYFANKERFPKLKEDDDIILTPISAPKEHQLMSYDRLALEELLEETLAIEELLEESSNLQKASSELLWKEEIQNEVKGTEQSFNNENTNVELKKSVSVASIGIQSDPLESFSESTPGSNFDEVPGILSTVALNETEIKSDKFEKTHTESQPLITDNEYSSFIKELVNGSEDKLAKFLINLSSEISSKSGEEKVANALMTVGYFQDNHEAHIVNSMKKKPLNDNMKLLESKVNKKGKDIVSVKKITRNERINSNKKNERNLLINRRSMSEINIHQLKQKQQYFNSYTERKFHSSRVDHLLIKKTNDECTRHDFPKNNAISNGEVIGRLCEIMTELKQNVDKICRKESTIRIENAQIWLKGNVDKNLQRKAIVSEKTKETYCQTIETIDVQVGDRIQRQSLGTTEILIVSNSNKDEINIKVNDKSTKNHFMVSSVDSLEKNKTDELDEIEERKKFFEENQDIPFNIVFNEKTHLPTLKKGKYEVEIFEKIDGNVVHETNFKNFMKKLTGSLSAIKLNGLQNFEKPQNFEPPIHSTKPSSSSNSKPEKHMPKLITSFLNRFQKIKSNAPAKSSNRQFVTSQHWSGHSSSQYGVLEPFLPENSKEMTYSPMEDDLRGCRDIEVFNVSSTCLLCNSDPLNFFEGDPWPDVLKTRYPNGMIHFGPLTLMPEPSNMGNIAPKNCSCHKSGCCRQYVFNKQMKHTMKASVSRNLGHQPRGEVSLEEFSETEHGFYQQWSRMGKV